jgi:predicted GH43/DUF377 family glycosyl hydrolase
MLYHGVRHTAPGACTGWAPPCSTAAPRPLPARGDGWIFGPEAPYERIGDVGNVVFPCG